ncbi:MAG: radical SAM protein [Armatimonadetes bacterium]|nr:radical SAM protein [Armatimonadota bacterium]NIM22728.1 radical SAM protein [Armatimonadota bacterium]NIM66558.1 radical SAM protein [Armatimonadota bacterium]NIM75094.1 radical SAM protein [Armatimonadota bacterium]NIN04778.1 radical SAM protein [Armatimonadota bacterium]
MIEAAPSDSPESRLPGFENLASPLFIAWQTTGVCNMGCLHCCEESGHHMPNEMNEEAAVNLCQEIIDLEIPYTALSGGEPLLHPNFFAICKSLRARGVSVKIETNGVFVDETMADRIAELGLRSVQLSVDGATPETHEKLRLRGDWEKTVQACRLLVEREVNTEIVFVPTKFNLHQAAEMVDLASSLGVVGFYTGKLMRIGRAAENWDLLVPSEEQYREFFTVLEKKAEQYGDKMKVYFYPYDVIEELRYRRDHPAASLLIIPDGRVKLIGPLPFICGQIGLHPLQEIWERYKQAWKDPRVKDYIEDLLKNPALVSNANNWINLF